MASPSGRGLPTGDEGAGGLGHDPESSEFWYEVHHARYELGAGHLLRWFVPPAAGHDDFLNALALLALAAADAAPPAADIALAPPRMYRHEGRY